MKNKSLYQKINQVARNKTPLQWVPFNWEEVPNIKIYDNEKIWIARDLVAWADHLLALELTDKYLTDAESVLGMVSADIAVEFILRAIIPDQISEIKFPLLVERAGIITRSLPDYIGPIARKDILYLHIQRNSLHHGGMLFDHNSHRSYIIRAAILLNWLGLLKPRLDQNEYEERDFFSDFRNSPKLINLMQEFEREQKFIWDYEEVGSAYIACGDIEKGICILVDGLQQSKGDEPDYISQIYQSLAYALSYLQEYSLACICLERSLIYLKQIAEQEKNPKLLVFYTKKIVEIKCNIEKIRLEEKEV